jgi:hypothetical protein
MNPLNSLITYTVKYDADRKIFTLWDDKNHMIGEHTNGRELGRDAWSVFGAEAVKYDYDLTKDEGIPLTVRY